MTKINTTNVQRVSDVYPSSVQNKNESTNNKNGQIQK